MRSTQEESQREHQTEGNTNPQVSPEQVRLENAPRKEAEVQEVSTLRQALLGRAAGGDGFAQFRGRREARVEPGAQTGVYCVQINDQGKSEVKDLSSRFHKGPELRTTDPN